MLLTHGTGPSTTRGIGTRMMTTLSCTMAAWPRVLYAGAPAGAHRTERRKSGDASCAAGHARVCEALAPLADAVPAIANRVYETLPGAGRARFPVPAGLRLEASPVTPAVALVG